MLRVVHWPTWRAAAALGVLLGSCAIGSESFDDDADVGSADTLSGAAEVLIARYTDHSERQYYVRTDDGTHVRVFFETDFGLIQPEEHLALAGRWNNEKSLGAPSFTATTVLKHLGVDHAAAGGDGSGGSSATAAAAQTRSPLLHRVAVILLGTPSYTKQQAWNQVNATSGSAAAYLTENSDGIDTFEGDVFGPYDVDTSSCADRVYQIADLAKAAVAKEGRSLSGYTNLAFVIPGGQGCGWGGLGQVGNPGSTRQMQTWYSNWFDCGVVAHELGHNLGMNHSHSTSCPGALYAAGRGGCKDNEYGHPFDVMGDASCGRDGHFSAPQKQFMGWLAACEDVTAGGSAVFNLSPVEGGCGLRSLRIPIAGETNYYYVEYRKQGAGEFAGARGQDRVTLSVSNDGATVRPDLYFLDATPSTVDRRDGWLNVGTTYNLPGSVQIKVLELGEMARVQVVMPAGSGPVCHNGETPPTDSLGRIGAGCGDGCPSDPKKTAPGYCGCGVPDVDTDGDGTRDCNDGCPTDSNKSEPGQCGCGVLELSCSGLSPGLIRKHYTGQWSTLPSFAQLEADEEKVVSAVDVKDYAGTDGFAVVFTGGIRIDRAGTYDFELSSDDGSRLRIDDREIISNDGIHGLLAKSGSVALSAGAHAIRVEFFERSGGESLRLRYRVSGGAYADVPSSILVHPSSSTPDQCPNDPNKTAPGLCGCGAPDADSDRDGTVDCKDACPSDVQKTAPGVCGCNVADADSDRDGTVDCRDRCPTDPMKTEPGSCGCGKAEGSCGDNVQTQCVQADEGRTAMLACPSGQTITKVEFASYGTPSGACGSFAPSSCHAATTINRVEQACIGKTSCSVSATNGVFGDPCVGTFKRLAVEYVCERPLTPGLERAHYSGYWSVLPNFGALSPDARDVAEQVTLGRYAGTERFGLVFTGYIRIASAGDYEFELSSDDGSRLLIDGQRIIDNDGAHALRSVVGGVRLDAGLHEIRVEYFERTGGEGLRLGYRLVGGSFAEVPASVLQHRPTN